MIHYTNLSDKHQCKEWTELILKSIENIDDREIRQKIIQHPFNCSHPICQQVAKHMKEIDNATRG